MQPLSFAIFSWISFRGTQIFLQSYLAFTSLDYSVRMHIKWVTNRLLQWSSMNCILLCLSFPYLSIEFDNHSAISAIAIVHTTKCTSPMSPSHLWKIPSHFSLLGQTQHTSLGCHTKAWQTLPWELLQTVNCNQLWLPPGRVVTLRAVGCHAYQMWTQREHDVPTTDVHRLTWKKINGDSQGFDFFHAGWLTCTETKNNNILLMEDILHQLGCIKPCKWWDKLPTSSTACWFSTGAGAYLQLQGRRQSSACIHPQPLGSTRGPTRDQVFSLSQHCCDFHRNRESNHQITTAADQYLFRKARIKRPTTAVSKHILESSEIRLCENGRRQITITNSGWLHPTPCIPIPWRWGTPTGTLCSASIGQRAASKRIWGVEMNEANGWMQWNEMKWNEWVNEWMKGWKTERMNGRMHGWINEWMPVWICICIYMDGWTKERTNDWVNESMNQWNQSGKWNSSIQKGDLEAILGPLRLRPLLLRSFGELLRQPWTNIKNVQAHDTWAPGCDKGCQVQVSFRPIKRYGPKLQFVDSLVRL